MNDLIPINTSDFGQGQVLTVDARLLHERLGVSQKFADWLPYRLERYGFEENVDYWVFLKSQKNSPGGRPAKDYALTIDMAKELCMVENNAQGRKIRKYFIECEKRYRASLAAAQANLEIEDRRMVARGLERLANSGLYTPVRSALFTAEAVSVLSGKPMTEYLPPVANMRDRWPTPTELGERFNESPKRRGSILKGNNLHGSKDEEHAHSEPFWNKALFSERQVISYKYAPEVVVPVIQRALGIKNLN